MGSFGLRAAGLAWVVALVLALPAAGVSPSPDKGDPIVLVAKCVSVAGALFRKEGDGAWQSVAAKEPLGKTELLVALPEAEFHSANGAVGLRLVADVGQRGPLPVLEAAVALHEAAQDDLDVTLHRGIIVLTNHKQRGSAKARVRFRGASWLLTLEEPGTRVGLELYALYPPGLHKITDGKLGEPTTTVLLLVLKGQVYLDAGPLGVRLTAPPGPAKVIWDNVSGRPEVERLDKLPESVRPRDARELKTYEVICRATRRLVGHPAGPVLDSLVKSKVKEDRLVAVTCMGALDDLPQLIAALANPHHADVRDQAVLVLRHWMAHGQGQALKLYQALVKDGGYTPVQARTVVQLLFGFSDEDRTLPATYDLLVHNLLHAKVAVRELTRWHLVRLVPAGTAIAYNPAGTEAQRRAAYKQWRELIPEGRLPRGPSSVSSGKK
jgi:hypothetical protein